MIHCLVIMANLSVNEALACGRGQSRHGALCSTIMSSHKNSMHHRNPANFDQQARQIMEMSRDAIPNMRPPCSSESLLGSVLVDLAFTPEEDIRTFDALRRHMSKAESMITRHAQYSGIKEQQN